MARRITEVAGKIESHWTLYNLLRENWGWAVTALGLGGAGGWWAWLVARAAEAPWYEKGLVALFAFLVITFLVTGVRAFLASHRRSARDEGAEAAAAKLSWSGHAYTNGSIIEGGTHRLSEIFGTDQLRSNLLVRLY